jgi:hypothetical protein
MKNGQWLKILYMAGEPHYTGKIGQVEHTDDKGQIHGTWGGCALRPMDGDRYALLTEEQARAELVKQADANAPKQVKGGSFKLICPVEMRNPCTREWFTLKTGAVKVDLGGATGRCVIGVADTDARYIASVVDSVTGVKNTAFRIEVYPLDARKKVESYIESLKDAVRKAMEQ